MALPYGGFLKTKICNICMNPLFLVLRHEGIKTVNPVQRSTRLQLNAFKANMDVQWICLQMLIVFSRS